MINYLREKIHNHMVLYHDGIQNELLNICDSSSKAQRMNLPPEEKINFDQFINTHWNIFCVQYNKSLFLVFLGFFSLNKHCFTTSLRV